MGPAGLEPWPHPLGMLREVDAQAGVLPPGCDHGRLKYFARRDLPAAAGGILHLPQYQSPMEILERGSYQFG
ncbi:MAG: hypothetical protein AMJ88_11900 [Anaerolineae bacterium SM23_ 63]|nr:MAG: hypothetical protein AMJ88_11900 [Anaerolineae bacterium SM23_ 63]HEY47860.1 hypothetical protein [Anaerolineae bacterium]